MKKPDNTIIIAPSDGEPYPAKISFEQEPTTVTLNTDGTETYSIPVSAIDFSHVGVFTFSERTVNA